MKDFALVEGFTPVRTFEAESAGKCPCGGEISVAIDPPAVLHALPTCDQYDKLEADVYVTYVVAYYEAVYATLN